MWKIHYRHSIWRAGLKRAICSTVFIISAVGLAWPESPLSSWTPPFPLFPEASQRTSLAYFIFVTATAAALAQTIISRPGPGSLLSSWLPSCFSESLESSCQSLLQPGPSPSSPTLTGVAFIRSSFLPYLGLPPLQRCIISNISFVLSFYFVCVTRKLTSGSAF